MLPYAPPIHNAPMLRRIAVAAARDTDFDGRDRADFKRFDATRCRVAPHLEIGETFYLFRDELTGAYFPGRGQVDGEFLVPEFYPDFVGRGRSLDDAFLDWRNQIHLRFQELYSKRPFEMTESEKATWRLLERRIDVPAYKRTTPLVIRQIGKVDEARPFPSVIKWEDGSKERVRPDQMPGEFMAYKPGQRFEAIVERDPIGFQIKRTTYVRRLKSVPRVTSDDITELLRSIPTSRSLPNAGWD